MAIPTLTQMEKVYYVAAEVERMKCGRPGKNTVENTRLGVRTFRRCLNERRESLGYARIGFDEDFPRVTARGSLKTAGSVPATSRRRGRCRGRTSWSVRSTRS